MNHRICYLPEATQFNIFLMERSGGKQLSMGEQEVGRADMGRELRIWKIYLGQEYLGTYGTIQLRPGEHILEQLYYGRIPDYYKNDLVWLHFNNRRYDGDNERCTNTPWQRQDPHDSIPFP